MEKKKHTMELRADSEEKLQALVEAVTYGISYQSAWTRMEKYLMSQSEFNKAVPAADLLKRMDKILKEEKDENDF